MASASRTLFLYRQISYNDRDIMKYRKETENMETYDTLTSRRSVKKYKPEPLDHNTLMHLVKAGQNAPSGQNRQSFAFVVAKNPELVKELSVMNAEIMKQRIPTYDNDPFYGAPNVIVVLADTNIPTHVYDGSLAMGNLLNAAYDMGLGASWIHRAKEVFETEKGQQLLKDWGLEGYEGIGFCIVGHADEQPAYRERFSKVVVC